MPFLKPQLAFPLEDRAVLADPAYVAEPKLDGQRAQVHVADGQTVACYSRTGRDMLRETGVAWLRAFRWPWPAAILDAELYAGTGGNGTGPEVMSERAGTGSLALAAFDVLAIAGEDLTASPWTLRRGRLEELLGVVQDARVQVVPVSTDPQGLWDSWVGMFGGEGIMVKLRDAPYLVGKRSRAWLKLKVEMTVDVVITGVTTKPTYDRAYHQGEAALTFGFWEPAAGRVVPCGQGLVFGRRADLEAHVGKVAEALCAGIMPSGGVRHHRFLRFRDDKPVEACTR